MRLILGFKTPDVIESAVEDLTPEDQIVAQEACEKFIKYGEFVQIEIDTDTQEARVLPV